MDGMVNGMGYGSSLETGWFVFVLIFAVVSFLAILFTLLVNIKIFTKAGKPWWVCLIPIYNIIVYMDIAQIKYTNLLFLLIPFVGIIIFIFKLYIGLAKSFNKSVGFGIGMIFLPIIFFPILAFSKDEVNKGDAQVVDAQNNYSNIEMVNNINYNNNVSGFSNNIQENVSEDNSLNIIQREDGINNTMEVMNMDLDIPSNVIQNNSTKLEEVIEEIETMEIDTLNDNIVNEFSIDDLSDNAISNTISETNLNFELDETSTNNISSNFEQIDINQINNMNESINPSVEQNDIEMFDNITDIGQDMNLNKSSNDIVSLESLNINQENINNVKVPKVCKNCGAEMPSIVTICPKCGTDNE